MTGTGHGADVGLSNADHRLLERWGFSRHPFHVFDDPQMWSIVLIGRLQSALNWFFFGPPNRLTVDGKWGRETQRAYREAAAHLRWRYDIDVRPEVEEILVELRRIGKEPTL